MNGMLQVVLTVKARSCSRAYVTWHYAMQAYGGI
jgi:hypothetical protein